MGSITSCLLTKTVFGGKCRISGTFLFVLYILISSSWTVSASEPTIMVSSYQVQPEVVMPGGSALITVTITNTAEKASVTTTQHGSDTGTSVSTTSDINAYISDVFLFGNGLHVDSGDYRRVGELGPGQSVPLPFLVRAPDRTGIFFPELSISSDGGRSLKYPIPVNVNDDRLVQKNPSLMIKKELPLSVEPGSDTTGKLILRNTGETAACEVFVNITPRDPGLSLKSPQITHIGKLEPGDEVPVDMDIMTSSEAEEGIHSLISHIRYSSASGRLYEQDEVIPVKFTGIPELAIATVTSDPVRVARGDPFSLIIRIENTGTGDATGVRARIETSMNGTKEAFVGKIEDDNDAPAVFYLQNPPEGDLFIPVTIWEQDNESNAVSDTININVGNGGMSPLIPAIIIVVIIVAAGYLVLKRRAGAR